MPRSIPPKELEMKADLASFTRQWPYLGLLGGLVLAVCANGSRCGEEAAVATTPRVADVVYVATPHDVVARMLSLAQIDSDTLVYDLGCGDGRVVATAARAYGCRGMGFDISPERVAESRETVQKYGVSDRVQIAEQDIFELDLTPANVITLYLLPRLNVRLIPQLDMLQPGSRIVSHDFDMEGVEPDRVVEMVSKEDGVEHTIYVWTTPLKKTE
jgi:SAM-dependent methyltransferase